MTIEEGNILIANFTGFEWKEHPFNTWYHNGIDVGYLKFHESWDWLMPVVEKIESLGWKVDMPSFGCQIHLKLISFPNFATTKILAVWLSVIDFIEWYNATQEDK